VCFVVFTNVWAEDSASWHMTPYLWYPDSEITGNIRLMGDRIPVGARFSAPIQTGPGVHPASYTMGTGSFPELKRQGRGVDHPPPSSAEVKERV
jgi:hypothetical protein